MNRPDLLIVDDDPNTIRLFSRILADEAAMRFALNGADALKLARQQKPALILLDAEMPGMDGFAVCKALKADATLADIPVVFVTSHDDATSEFIALELGAADFLSKPLMAAQVIARVRTQVRQKRLVEDVTRLASYLPTIVPLRRRTKILMVDDDPSVVQALHGVLKDLDTDFVFACTGEEALRLADQTVPDLLLLDLQLAGMNGIDVCREWMQHPVLRFVPVVFVTRFNDAENESAALAAGGTDFIAKPYSAAVLKARVRNVLRLKQQTDTALRSERARWQRVGDARVTQIVVGASDAIITADERGDIVLVNPAACRLMRARDGYLIGQPLNRFLPDGWDAPDEHGSPPGGRRRLIAVRSNRERFPVELSVSRIDTDEGHLTTVFLFDLSAREAAERKAHERMRTQAVEDSRRNLLDGLARDLGQSLSGILEAARHLQQEVPTPLPAGPAGRLDQLLDGARQLQRRMDEILAPPSAPMTEESGA